MSLLIGSHVISWEVVLKGCGPYGGRGPYRGVGLGGLVFRGGVVLKGWVSMCILLEYILVD